MMKRRGMSFPILVLLIIFVLVVVGVVVLLIINYNKNGSKKDISECIASGFSEEECERGSGVTSCGDGICNGAETCSSCPTDCRNCSINNSNEEKLGPINNSHFNDSVCWKGGGDLETRAGECNLNHISFYCDPIKKELVFNCTICGCNEGYVCWYGGSSCLPKNLFCGEKPSCSGSQDCINDKCVPKNNLNMALIFLRYQDMEGTPPSILEIENHYIKNMVDFWREDSYSYLSLSIDSYGWFTIPSDFSFPLLDDRGNPLIREIMEKNNIELDNYDVTGFVYYEDSAGAGQGASSAGRSTFVVGFDDNILSRKYKSMKWDLLDKMLNHEFGHTLSLGDSGAFICSEQNCVRDTYANPYSVMGTGGEPYTIGHSWGIESFDTAIHTLASDKYLVLGFLKEKDLLQIHTSGQYTIGPLHGEENGYRAAHFVRDGKDYYIEWRTPFGFDEGLSNTIIRNGNGGLIVYYLNSSRNFDDPTLLDLNPNSSISGRAQFELEEGKTFTEESAGFSLKVNHVSKEEVEFSIDFAD